MLKNAVLQDAIGGHEIFYMDKNKAMQLLSTSGILRAGSRVRDGFVMSITDPHSPVKPTKNKQTDTQQFKRWFGKSKVVKPDGTPMVVYHGTDADFSEFKKGDTGFHFGTKQAAQDRMKAMGGDRLIDAYIRIEHPLTVDADIGSWDGLNLASYIINDDPDLFEGLKITKELRTELSSVMDEARKELAAMAENGVDISKLGYDNPANIALRKFLKDHGIDGIKYLNDFEGDGDYSYIVFDANQAKSASENRGTFFSESNDIFYQRKQSPSDLTTTDAMTDMDTDLLAETEGERDALERFKAANEKYQAKLKEIEAQHAALETANGDAKTEAQNRLDILQGQSTRLYNRMMELGRTNTMRTLENRTDAFVKKNIIRKIFWIRNAKAHHIICVTGFCFMEDHRYVRSNEG